MSVENLSEFGNYTSRFGDGQVKPNTDKQTEKAEETVPAKVDHKLALTSFDMMREEGKGPESSMADSEDSSILQRLKSINEQFPLKSTSLVFEFDDANDPPVVKVVDKESGDVIREIPPKELREIAKALSEIADNLSKEAGPLHEKQVSGILINEQL